VRPRPNVTALVDTSGDVVQRFVYSPYGVQTVLDGSWAVSSSPSYSVYGFQDGRTDLATGLVHFGDPGRDLNPSTGTWTKQDSEYYDGANLYQFEKSNTIDNLDVNGHFLGIPIGTGSRAAIGSVCGAGGYLVGCWLSGTCPTWGGVRDEKTDNCGGIRRYTTKWHTRSRYEYTREMQLVVHDWLFLIRHTSKSQQILSKAWGAGTTLAGFAPNPFISIPANILGMFSLPDGTWDPTGISYRVVDAIIKSESNTLIDNQKVDDGTTYVDIPGKNCSSK
jgi:RHS repeat-associated protein